MHMRVRVTRLAGVTDENASSGATEYEGCREPRRSAACDDYVEEHDLTCTRSSSPIQGVIGVTPAGIRWRRCVNAAARASTPVGRQARGSVVMRLKFHGVVW
jgi:hypothetical protein